MPDAVSEPTNQQKALFLKQVLEVFVAGEESWTQGVWARDKDGRRVSPNAPDACQWCLDGSAQRVFSTHYRGGPDFRVRRHALNELDDRLVVNDYVSFNDAPETTFAHVQRLLEDTITNLEETA